ncbi:MAG: ribonuclease P protein component [Gammaproteobacteria bacterium]
MPADAPGSLPSNDSRHPAGAGDHRFRRAQRILASAHFIRVLRTGRRFAQEPFTVHCCNNNLDQARLGIAVGRRVSRHAYERNTIKRIVREQFRRLAPALPAVDIVITARPAAAAASRADLAAAVRAALGRCRRSESPAGGKAADG